jgi:hypothetical protein
MFAIGIRCLVFKILECVINTESGKFIYTIGIIVIKREKLLFTGGAP